MANNSAIVSVGNSGPVLLGTITAAAVNAAPVTSGPMMLEARRMKSWLFTLGGTFTGFSVLFQGTSDANTSGYIGYPNTPPNSNWFQLVAESDQSATGTESNPLTSTTASLSYAKQLFAVRFIASAVGTATGTCLIFGFATQ